MNIFETLAHSARQWPKRTAIIDATGALDYQSLWREIEALRRQLARSDVRPGQGVGVRARNGRAFVIAALAALGSGAVVMPVHHQMKPQELADMLARAPLRAILSDNFGPPPDGDSTSVLKLLDGTIVRFIGMPGPDVPLTPWIEDAAFVRFTSGTTGAAKGVVLTHHGILERTRAANAGLGLTGEDRVLWVLPMAYHFYVSILLYLEAGATVIVSADYLAESILDAAIKHHATFLYVTPMHVRMLTGEPSKRPLPPSLTRVMSVSSRLHPQAAREFQARYGVPVCQGYGIIEVGLPIMNISEAAEHPETIGRPLPDFEAAIFGDALKAVSPGATGQLALRGPGMFAGYLSPPRPRDGVLRDGWFLTGDLAHRDSAGRIVLDGRTASVINVAGLKVFPEEVAAVLDQHPAVLRSRVTTRPHPQTGEVVHADVQLRHAGPAATEDELLAFCRKRLSNYKVPASLELVSELALTSSGKVRHG
jgi:acyl-CoA synthetase (AMP-forming)/AMP-acid ligase II